MSNVTHPSHYNSGKIEVIEAIEDWGLSYHRGNVVKYVARAGKKDPAKEIEDLEKAAWYLARDIENLKAAKEGRAPIRPNAMNPKSSVVTPASPSLKREVLLDSVKIATGKVLDMLAELHGIAKRGINEPDISYRAYVLHELAGQG